MGLFEDIGAILESLWILITLLPKGMEFISELLRIIFKSINYIFTEILPNLLSKVPKVIDLLLVSIKLIETNINFIQIFCISIPILGFNYLLAPGITALLN